MNIAEFLLPGMKGHIIKQKDRRTGFSLLEVIVAIYILIVGIIGVMTLTVTTTKAGAVSSSKLIAANLAQEGIEVVRNIRDLNYEEPAVGCAWTCWHTNLVGGNYFVQYNDTALRTYAGAPPPLLYDSSTGLYGYATGSASKYNFRRVITLGNIDPGKSVKITSTVTWTENGRSHSLVVEDNLWNWR